jgi:riboflavin kinase/FMN adenylyltransferase
MQVIHQASEFGGNGRKVCLAIGMFDGVHLGHQQVLRQTVQDARQHGASAVAVTFDRHPSSVIAPDRAPRLIYSLPQKLREIAALGLNATLLFEFTPEFSKAPADQFIRDLSHDFALQSICVGSAFRFGFKRAGNIETLRDLGQELGFGVRGLSALSLGGKTISSTRIREAIAAGRLNEAAEMLGRSYSLAGVVKHGDHRGRELGFPTANVEIDSLMVPPFGVYAVRAQCGGGIHSGVVNIGTRPTIDNSTETRVEAHLLDFQGDLYGKELELVFLERIRGEIKFPSLGALKSRIAADVEWARKFFV